MKYLLALLLALLFLSCSTQEIVLSEGEMMSDLHRNNIGAITFMNDVVPFEDYSEDDFKKEVTFGNSKELSIRIFLARTLTSYLHDLAPELDVNALCKKGNFEVSFLLDGKEAFKERLNAGAGSCWYKNSATVYRIPFVSLEEVDHWGTFMWGRFKYRNGGQDLLEVGTHDFRVELRPYLSLNEDVVGDIIASGEVKLIVEEEEVEVEESEIAIQKIANGSGWEVSNDNFDDEKIRSLNREITAKKFKEISSVVIVKDGKLLIEEYFTGSDRKEKFNTRSVGKSFMSAVMGIAIDKGFIKSVDEPLSAFYDLKKFDNYSEEKGRVTLKQFLTMSSGFEGDDSNMESPGNEEYMYPSKNWVKFALDQPLRGDFTWRYFTAGSVVMGDVIHKSVPGGLEAFADEYLFKPLGITDYQWQYTPQKVANTAGGIQMSALDFAKFGLLYKNQGIWDGKQVISKEWVAKSFEKHAVVDEGKGDYYGYQFWQKTFEIDGELYPVNYCTGTGGNKIYIFETQPLVVVITTKAFRLPQAHHQVRKMMEEYILPAVLSQW
jgi:CubicO group peptidase (beta-lactamase class C family)